MNKTELFDKLQMSILDDFPSAIVSLFDYQDMSKSYTGLKVEFERDLLSPVFDFDKLSQMIQTEYDLESISKIISEEIKRAVVYPSANIDILKDYNLLKDHLCVDVVSVAGHGDMLKAVPYQTLNRDMAIIAKAFLMDSIERSDRLYMTTIDNAILNSLDISKETLFKDAMENFSRVNPTEILTVSDFIFGEAYYTNPTAALHDNAKFPIRILTTRTGACPLSAILDETLLQRLGHQYNGNFYLVPSSIGCFALPEEFPKAKELIMTVESAVKDWCELSNKHELVGEVQHYDREGSVLEPKAVMEQRMTLLVQEQLREQKQTPEKKPEKGKELGR